MTDLTARFPDLIADDPAPCVTEDCFHTTTEALAVLLPRDRFEVEAIVDFCRAEGIALVPQGGNTNRTCAAIPERGRRSIVVNLKRMNRVVAIGEARDHIVLEAGCTLADAQQAAAAVECMVGVDLGARDSCQIGGNIATNAGGMRAMRYGTMRENVLGLEVVTGLGTSLDLRNRLRKNNAGYDLKQLFIGSEGTLGIVTAAVLRLYPMPRDLQLAALSCPNVVAAIGLHREAVARWGASLQRSEYLNRAVQATVRRTPGCPPPPFTPEPDALVLLEISDAPDPDPWQDWLLAMTDAGLVDDVVLPRNEAEVARLWDIRERCGHLGSVTGAQVKHDLALPLERMAEFLTQSATGLDAIAPEAIRLVFGHLGDGNLHYNLASARPEGSATLVAAREALNRTVEDLAVAYGGTFSAEHGIGGRKVSALARLTPPAVLEYMEVVKRSLDPDGIMNPGKVLSDSG